MLAKRIRNHFAYYLIPGCTNQWLYGPICNQYLSILQPLESSNWPEEEDHKILYVDQEMVKVAKLLSLPVNKAVEQFRTWKRTGTAEGDTLQKILCAAINLQLQFSRMSARLFSS